MLYIPNFEQERLPTVGSPWFPPSVPPLLAVVTKRKRPSAGDFGDHEYGTRLDISMWARSSATSSERLALPSAQRLTRPPDNGTRHNGTSDKSTTDADRDAQHSFYVLILVARLLAVMPSAVASHYLSNPLFGCSRQCTDEAASTIHSRWSGAIQSQKNETQFRADC